MVGFTAGFIFFFTTAGALFHKKSLIYPKRVPERKKTLQGNFSMKRGLCFSTLLSIKWDLVVTLGSFMLWASFLITSAFFLSSFVIAKISLFFLRNTSFFSSLLQKKRLPFFLLSLVLFSIFYFSFLKKEEVPFFLVEGCFLFLLAETAVSFFSLFTEKKKPMAFIRLISWLVTFAYIKGYVDPFLHVLGKTTIEIGSNKLSLLSLSKATLATTFFIWLALFFSNYLERKLENHKHLQPSMRLIFTKLIKTLSISFSLYFGLSLLGIDLSALSFFAGALGVGIAFGLQNILANFFCGFILLADRSIKPGDVVSLGDNIYGVVHKLSARYVSVKTRQGKEHLIPNQQIVTNKLENWSYSDPFIRLEIPFTVSLKTDLEELQKYLLEIASSCLRVVKAPSPSVRFTDLSCNAVHLKLYIWIKDPQNGLSSIRSEILFKAWKLFLEKGIQIPASPMEIVDSSLREIPNVSPSLE